MFALVVSETLGAVLIGLRYIYNVDNFSNILGFIAASVGHFFLIALLVNLVFVFIPALFRIKSKLIYFVNFIILSLLFIFLITDTFVFQQYHFHVNLAMLDLFLNSDGEVITFGTSDKIKICLMVLGCLVYSFVTILIGIKVLPKFKKAVIALSSCAFVLLLAYNVVNIVEAATGNRQFTSLNRTLPLFHPLTMNSRLKKMGFNVVSENLYKLSSKNEILNYPHEPLVCPKPDQKLPNIYLIVIDTLRNDVVTPKIMPFFDDFASKEISFKKHFSGGNCTRTGIFSMFYGLSGNYWQSVLDSRTPPVMITELQNLGYKINAYTSANLFNPEFNLTVFSRVKDLRTESKGNTSYERDDDALKDFFDEASRKSLKPSLNFIFLDQLHSIELDPSTTESNMFPTTWTSPHYADITSSTNPENFFNLYKNVAHAIDKKIGKIISFLKAQDLYDDSIIIVTSDHGNEFNDTGLNYWGHNSNFTPFQTQVPLAIHWPGKQTQTIDYLTSGYDISTTILKDLLQCENPVENYSVGKSLFSETPKRSWVISTSYNENGVISKDQVAVIDTIGRLSFKTHSWKDLPQDMPEKRNYVLDALDKMSVFYKKNK